MHSTTPTFAAPGSMSCFLSETTKELNNKGTKVEILLIVIMLDQAPLAVCVLFLIMSWLIRRLPSHLVQYHVINTDENDIFISTVKLLSHVMHVLTEWEGKTVKIFAYSEGYSIWTIK